MPHLKKSGKVIHRIQGNAFLICLLSLIWFLLRTGRKPSRAAYSCQRVAAVNGQMWLAIYVSPISSVMSRKTSSTLNKKRLIITIIAFIAVSSLTIHGWRGLEKGGRPLDQADSTTGIDLTSTDPMALDCWAAKHILLQAAPGGVDSSSMDPDQTGSGSFGAWLRLSMHEISGAGYQATVHEGQMNVYVARLGS